MTAPELVSILGLVVALIGVWANLALARKKRLQDKRAEAYVDFLKTLILVAKPPESPDLHLALKYSHLEARARILLFGSPSVKQSWYCVAVSDSSFANPVTAEKLGGLIQAMQIDTYGGVSEMQQILETLNVEGKRSKQ
jgi:hypothetical protein